VAQIAAQGDNRVGRPEAAAQQAEDVEIAQPLAVGDITLAPRHVLDVAGIDENHLEPPGLEDLEDGNQ
jgi:hypothetical protein